MKIQTLLLVGAGLIPYSTLEASLPNGLPPGDDGPVQVANYLPLEEESAPVPDEVPMVNPPATAPPMPHSTYEEPATLLPTGPAEPVVVDGEHVGTPHIVDGAIDELDDDDYWDWSKFCPVKDLPPHYAYPPAHHGYYYFRPYNFIHILRHQRLAEQFGGDPRMPYSTTFLQNVYVNFPAASEPPLEAIEVPRPNLRVEPGLPDLQEILGRRPLGQPAPDVPLPNGPPGPVEPLIPSVPSTPPGLPMNPE